MRTFTLAAEMAAYSESERQKGRRISFVPTMGYLHEGHLALVREGKRRGDSMVVSIFVNPTQFDEAKDLEVYPRDLGRDAALLEAEGVDILFAPAAKEIYPEGFQTFVEVTEITKGLCGRSRPGHFRGVATVVAKLFNIVRPHVALFGEKDYQQLALIRRMATDLHMGLEIVGMPIVREADGLAMSSRNVRLSADERGKALSLSRALRKGAALCLGGLHNASRIVEEAAREIEGGVEVDYMEIVDTGTLRPVDRINGEALFAVAARVGQTRLIDNTILKEE